jgi:hypothetical protein
MLTHAKINKTPTAPANNNTSLGCREIQLSASSII